jgi:hypothetical protein
MTFADIHYVPPLLLWSAYGKPNRRIVQYREYPLRLLAEMPTGGAPYRVEFFVPQRRE